MEKQTNDLIKERIKKIEDLRNENINPYPYRFHPSHKSLEIKKILEKNKEKILEDIVSLSGRIMTMRKMGKATFMHLQDSQGRLQLYFQKNNVGNKNYELLKKLDLGDILGVKGTPFFTRTGEPTLNVNEYKILSKSIRPLPDKWSGIKDKEFRYRQRSVDLIVNESVRKTFEKRTLAIKYMREFLDDKGFMEVETPILQNVYGGASARPFVTKLNSLNIPQYLSISPELYLKRLVVGGFEKVYTICKNFRNEGIDATHNPEFTMMECYWAGADYNDMMSLTEDLYEFVFNKVLGSTKVKYGDENLDFKAPWKKISMYEAIKENTGIDVENLNKEELVKKINFLGYDDISFYEDASKGLVVQELFENYCEDKIRQPTFIIDHPKESTPLCKIHRNNSELIERFEPFVAGVEIGNAYSELNDPVLQRQLFEEQQRQLSQGNKEAHPLDEEFLRAVEYGLPVTGGLGLGIDRMVMFMTDSQSIRDVILFPFMKPVEYKK